MATILDVAKLAGVSQGTVSNVLNRKGNVSSEKIRLVEEAAQALGFTINEKAKILRKGGSNALSVILPNIQFKQYRDFYMSFKICAEKNGYSAELMLTNDNPDEELAILRQAKAELKEGIAVISCLNGAAEDPVFRDFSQKVCYVERCPGIKGAYYGFDYRSCGKELAQAVNNRHYDHILFVYGRQKYSNIKEIVETFCDCLDNQCDIIHISAEALRLPHLLMEVFDRYSVIDAVVTIDFGYAERIRQITHSLLGKTDIPIYTVSPVFTLPEPDYHKYELNYNLLGKRVAEDLIRLSEEELRETKVILENDGFRKWHDIAIGRERADTLNMLALEGPESSVIKGLARMYEEKTGTKINTVVWSYEEMYEAFANAELFGVFDIFRIDVTWLSWLADKILLPLESIEEDISDIFEKYIPSLSDKYARINGRIYALPVTPSVQLLFYRKDLFDDVAVKRAYFETYKCNLKVPETFEEFNQIAGFFTKSLNSSSKVRYGTSLTLGNSGVASTEFLARFFSMQEHLYGEDGRIVINNDVGIAAMENLLEATKFIDSKRTYWWTDAAKNFADGDVAMEIIFSNFASEILGHKSKIIDKIGYDIVPGRNPVIGGGSLAIAKNSRYPLDALKFIKWLTKDPIASAVAALGGVSPCAKTYEIFEIIDTFPWLELSKECFLLSKTRRLPIKDDRPFNEKKFISIVGGMVKNVCASAVDAKTALNIAQKMIDEQFNR